jgi:glyoxalase family protein
MQLNGIHHVTAVTAKVGVNRKFYTGTLGMRLVKKTVNQDDVSAYHLFYADKLGSPGTDMTFFDWPVPAERRGTDSVVATMLRVNGQAALAYWAGRLAERGVRHGDQIDLGGRAGLPLEDPEGQRLILVDDDGAPFAGEAWDGADVPEQFAIRGFYAVLLSVPRHDLLAPVVTLAMELRETQRYAGPESIPGEVVVYAMGAGGPGNELHVVAQPNLGGGRLGAGGVHHVAFRVADDAEQLAWRERLETMGLGITPQIDRFYFRSVYFRVSHGLLFEIATDGPGFATDEDAATLGERLALPPFLEPQRAAIEAGLRPIPA